MHYKYMYYNNDGKGRGRVCSYFDPCPQWFAKGSGTISEEMKDVTENWARFCNAYKVKKVFRLPPVLRIIGSRSYKLASRWRQLEGMADHPITVMTEDGKYLWVGSNYTGNGELEDIYSKDTIPLGDYKGFTYEMRRAVLPPEYSFYNARRSDCLTFVWECVKCPILKNQTI